MRQTTHTSRATSMLTDTSTKERRWFTFEIFSFCKKELSQEEHHHHNQHYDEYRRRHFTGSPHVHAPAGKQKSSKNQPSPSEFEDQGHAMHQGSPQMYTRTSVSSQKYQSPLESSRMYEEPSGSSQTYERASESSRKHNRPSSSSQKHHRHSGSPHRYQRPSEDYARPGPPYQDHESDKVKLISNT